MSRAANWGWPTVALCAYLMFLDGAVMTLTRVKGLVLPCGSALGCSEALQRSPAILGLHLTDYALLFAAGGLAVLGLAASPRTSARAVRWVLPWMALGFGASVLSNGYNYVAHGLICPYCAAYGGLSFISVAILANISRDGVGALARNGATCVTVAGALASLCFLGLKIQIDKSRQEGAVVGVSIPEILGDGPLVLGQPTADRQLVCFYNPTCGVCREVVQALLGKVGPQSNYGLRVRAITGDENDVARRFAAWIDEQAGRVGPAAALSALNLPTDSVEPTLAGFDPHSPSFVTVDHDRQVATALGIHQTPTCLWIENHHARYAPCTELPPSKPSSG